jgi:hypothetical protein
MLVGEEHREPVPLTYAPPRPEPLAWVPWVVLFAAVVLLWFVAVVVLVLIFG